MSSSSDGVGEDKLAKAKKRTFAAFLGFSIPEILNFCTIFFMHFSKAFLDFLFNTPMRFIVFPCAAIYGLVKAGLSWNTFRLTRQDKKSTFEERTISFLQALWETLNGLGTTGAVITGIVGFFIGASVGMGISITFNFFLAASTVICAAYAGYYAYTANQAYKKWEKESLDKNTNHSSYIEYKDRRDKAITNLMITGIVALLTVGVTVAMVAGFLPIGAAIGVIGCLCGAAFSAYNLYKLMKKDQPSISEEKVPLLNRTNNANIHKEINSNTKHTEILNDPSIQDTQDTIVSTTSSEEKNPPSPIQGQTSSQDQLYPIGIRQSASF